MALCVVGVHSWQVTAPAEGYPAVSTLFNVFPVRVSFFFVLSGFLLGLKLHAAAGREARSAACRRHLSHSFRLFFNWALLYVPLALAAAWLNDAPWWRDLGAYFADLLLRGEPVWGQALWYVYSMSITVSIIYLFERRGWSLAPLWVFGVASAIYCNIYEYHSALSESPAAMFAYGILDRPLKGILFMLIGVALARYSGRVGRMWLPGLVLLAACPLLYGLRLPLLEQVAGTGMFMLAASVPMPESPVYLELRVMSKFVYFAHLFFIFAAWLLQHFGIVQWHYYELWAAAAIASLALAFTLARLRHRFPAINHWL